MRQLLREDILKELDVMVCIKHPPDYDIENVADNIMGLIENEIWSLING